MSTDTSAGIIDAALALGSWRVKTSRGTVSQPSFDEDVVTLSARAGLEILGRSPDVKPRCLIIATTSAPLPEPGIAPFLSEVFDLADPTQAVDVIEVAGTVSAGVGALNLAAQQVALGLGPVLVIAADARRDSSGRPLGSAAVAVLLDRNGDVGRVAPSPGSAGLFLDRWQRRDGGGVHVGDRSLDAYAPGRLSAPQTGAGETLKMHAAGPTIERVGFPGVAAPLAALLLADLADGDEIALMSTAGGVTRSTSVLLGPSWPEVAAMAVREREAGFDSAPPPEPDESGFDPFHSHPAAFRERGQTFRLEAARDPQSGRVLFPAPPAPIGNSMQRFRLGRRGVVATYARDHVYPLGSPLTMAIVDLQGGGRFYGQVADGADVRIGDQVELVLRRLHDGGGVPNYFWKIRPTESGA